MDWFAGLLVVRQTLRRLVRAPHLDVRGATHRLKQRVDLEDGSAGVPPATTLSRGRVLTKDAGGDWTCTPSRRH